ncbi:MAG: hypothetical protein Q7U66_12665 [Methylobacter sp.]|nr:hypothetical protein [Methylobacter sp.]
MIINWMAAKAQQFLPAHDTGLDELNVSFDFALSPEIMNLLYAQNDDCMDAGGRAATVGALGDAGAVAEAGQQAEPEHVNATAATQFALDEYELALA